MVQRAGVGYVMGCLEVRAENELPAFAQCLLHMQAERLHELVLVVQHCQIVVANQLFFTTKGAGGKHTGDGNLVKIGLDEPAFAIRLLIGKSIHDGFRKMAGVNTNTAILVFLAINEIGFVTFRNQVVVLNLVGPHAMILDTDHVSVLLRQPVEKAFFNSLGKAIDAD